MGIWKNIPICIYPFFKHFQNIPIVYIPIFSRYWKYTHLQYTHYFEKMGIFQNFHIPKKKTNAREAKIVCEGFSFSENDF